MIFRCELSPPNQTYTGQYQTKVVAHLVYALRKPSLVTATKHSIYLQYLRCLAEQELRASAKTRI